MWLKCCSDSPPTTYPGPCIIFSDDFNDAAITGWTVNSGSWSETTELTTTSTNAKISVTTTQPDGAASHWVEVKIAGYAGDVIRVHVGDHYAQVTVGATTENGCLGLYTAGGALLSQLRVDITADTLTTLKVWYGLDSSGDSQLGAYLNGNTQAVAFNVTRSGTSVALGTGSQATNVRFDDFVWVYHYAVGRTTCPEFLQTCRILSDTYNRANSTNVGCSYTETSGSWEIAGNRLQATGTGRLDVETKHPDAVARHYMQIDTVSGTAGDQVELHAGNHSARLTLGENTGCLELRSGGATLTKIMVDAPPTATNTLKVWYGITPVDEGGADNQIAAQVNGGQILRYNVVLGGLTVAIATGTVTSALLLENFTYEKHYSVTNLVCPTASPLPLCTILSDSFTRPDSTNVGCSYTESAGDWSISSNTLVVSSSTAILTVETKHPDAIPSHYVSVDVYGAEGDELEVHVGTTHKVRITIGAYNGCLALYDGGTLLTKNRIEAPPATWHNLQVWYGLTPVADGADSHIAAQASGVLLLYNVTRAGNSIALATGTVAGQVKFDNLLYQKHYTTTVGDESCPTISDDTCTIFSDSFGRPDNTNIGCALTETAGSWSIASFRLATSSSNAKATIETIDPEFSGDHAIAASFESSAVDDTIRVYTNIGNDTYGQLIIGTSKTFKLFVAGSEIASTTLSTSINTVYALTIIHADDIICAYLHSDIGVEISTLCGAAAANVAGPIKGGVGTGTMTGTVQFSSILLQRGYDDDSCPRCGYFCSVCCPPTGMRVTIAGADNTGCPSGCCTQLNAAWDVPSSVGYPACLSGSDTSIHATAGCTCTNDVFIEWDITCDADPGAPSPHRLNVRIGSNLPTGGDSNWRHWFADDDSIVGTLMTFVSGTYFHCLLGETVPPGLATATPKGGVTVTVDFY